MQFIELELSFKELLQVIRMMPESWWWKSSLGEMQTLFSYIHRDVDMEVLARVATSISTEIGRQWRREQTLKKLNEKGKISMGALVNCTVSEERIVTFSIPLEYDKMSNFYQVRVSPAGGGDEKGYNKTYCLKIFYPSEYGSVKWYGWIAANMMYSEFITQERVFVDNEDISIKAWNAICALSVAGAHAGMGILMDMARDGVI